MKKLTSMICLVLVWGGVQAQAVYKVIQPDGTVEFTDEPKPGEEATQIEVEPLNTTPPLATPGEQAAAAPAQAGYTSVRITSPDDNAAIRDNAGTVNVDVALDPALRSGDTIDILLDGQVVGGGSKTAITLNNMDRGSHRVQAVVKNGSGEVVARSNTVTFSLQRRSAILQPAPPKTPPPKPTPSGG